MPAGFLLTMNDILLHILAISSQRLVNENGLDYKAMASFSEFFLVSKINITLIVYNVNKSKILFGMKRVTNKIIGGNKIVRKRATNNI